MLATEERGCAEIERAGERENSSRRIIVTNSCRNLHATVTIMTALYYIHILIRPSNGGVESGDDFRPRMRGTPRVDLQLIKQTGFR